MKNPVKVVLFFFFITFLITNCTSKEYVVIEGFTQGTTYRIVHSDDVGHSLDSVVAGILFRIDNSLSVYNSESLISEFNRGYGITPDSLMINVFNRSYDIYKLSDGHFDVSAAPLFNIWGFGSTARSNVTEQILDSAMALIGMDKIVISDGRLIRKKEGVTLNFNAIAQGYTADVIAEELNRRGVKNYLVEVGGEIMCKGKNPAGKLWSVGIDKPVDGNIIQGAQLQDVLLLDSGGLATSGNYRKFYEQDGIKYSHTINPKTGYPVSHSLLSATVIAKDAITADAYATWFMVVGLEKAISITENTPGIESYLIYAQQEDFVVYKSSGVKLR